jgi:hypothetical protein
MHEAAEFNPAERELLLEACRIADRLDQLDGVVRGKGIEGLLHLRRMDDEGDITLTVDGVLAEARQQANIMKQLVAALRVPDEAGKRPQHRGARGAYSPRAGGSVTALDRARKAAGG